MCCADELKVMSRLSLGADRSREEAAGSKSVEY